MSKKHRQRILAEIDPERDMPLPERLKQAEAIETPVQPPEAEIEASKIKEAVVVEPVSTKANLYRR